MGKNKHKQLSFNSDINNPESNNLNTEYKEETINQTNKIINNNMEQSQIVPYNPPLFNKSNPFIQIRLNQAGILAGTITASITYTATHAAVNTTGTVTSTLLSTSGLLLSKAAKYTIGNAAEIAVSLTAETAAVAAKEMLQLNSSLTAVAVSAAVGTTTALAVSLGTSLLSSTASLIHSTSNYLYSKLPSKEEIYSYGSSYINHNYEKDLQLNEPLDNLGIETLD
jgi:hypothetical protein